MKPALRLVATNERRTFAHDPSARGYHAVYRRGELNRCPGCGRSQWYIGRLSAECAYCSTAIDLEKP